MASQPNSLDLIASNQSQKEATANALFTAASPAMIYARREQASLGLIWAYYGGVLKTPTGFVPVANGSVTLTDSADCYVEADVSNGTVSVNTVGFTTGRLALYKITVSATTATSWTDYRQALLAANSGDAGAHAFTELVDAPASYAGAASKLVAVRSDATGLEFVDAPETSADFTDLGDVPHSYTGQAGKLVSVNTAADGLEFTAAPDPGATTFVELTDAPHDYTGQAGKIVAVNAGADGLEFVDQTPPGGFAWVTSSEDIEPTDGVTLADDLVKVVAVAPGGSVESSNTVVFGADAVTVARPRRTIVIRSAQRDGNLQLDDDPIEYHVGQEIAVEGHSTTAATSFGISAIAAGGMVSCVTTDPDPAAGNVQFKPGSTVTVANSGIVGFDGDWVVGPGGSGSNLYLVGLVLPPQSVGSPLATLSGSLSDPNGTYTISAIDGVIITLTGWWWQDIFTAGNGTVRLLQEGGNIVVGQGASYTGNNGGSIGAGTIGDQDDAIAFGSRRITGLLPGVNDDDAATAGQLNSFGYYYNFVDLSGDWTPYTNLATGVHSTTLGPGGQALAEDSLTVGGNAIVHEDGVGSVALGNGTETDEPNVVAIGGRRLVDLADATAATDAVTLQQLEAVVVPTVMHDTIVATFDAGTAVLDVGSMCEIMVPAATTITGWTLLANAAGSVTLDVQQATYAAYPTMTSIVASSHPALASAAKGQDTALTGWTTSIAAGTILRVSITAATTIHRVTLILSTTRSF